MGFVLDDPDSIQAYHMLTQYYALKVYVEHGVLANRQMARRSLAKHIRQQYGVEGRTNLETLDNFELMLREKGILR